MKSSIFPALLLFPAALFAQQASLSKAQISVPGVNGVLKLDVGPTTWEARVRPRAVPATLSAHDCPSGLARALKVRFCFSISSTFW